MADTIDFSSVLLGVAAYFSGAVRPVGHASQAFGWDLAQSITEGFRGMPLPAP